MELVAHHNAAMADRLAEWSKRFDEVYASWLPTADNESNDLIEAMRYSALGPGKRFRPYLTVRCCELAGGREKDALPAAVAIECVHAFSLVHDDLPAMDDDDLRRGRPTNHKVYGEGAAILVGDALLTYAFEVLAAKITDSAISAACTLELARATGTAGMIGGQADDLRGEAETPSLALVKHIHSRKTARLIESACRLGGMTAGADSSTIDRLGMFGRHLGLAFQIADDLLDVCGETKVLGKRAAKDAARNKQTFPAAAGVEEARLTAQREAEAAIDSLHWADASADELRSLAAFVVERSA
jgi:geranylgeranyl diphosphate synthase type II